MGKIFELTKCSGCPNSFGVLGQLMRCVTNGNCIPQWPNIPAWCPLPDAPAPDYKVFNASEIMDAAKAFRERVDALRGELNAVHGWRVEVEKQLDELYKRMAKLERRKK